LRLTFLGTGGAGGVPRFGCDCAACQRARTNPQYVRRPCSALIEDGNHKVLLDAGLMDLHERFQPGELSAIVLTHYHADHVQGLLHLRWGKGESIPVYAPPDPEGFADLFKHPGILDIRSLAAFETLELGDFNLTPLPLNHSKLTFGYAIAHRGGDRFAYLTDTIGLPRDSNDFLRQWGAHEIAVDCSHPPTDEPPENHNDLLAALNMIQGSGAQRGWLTHLSHATDCWLMNNPDALPASVSSAMDGQVVDLAGNTTL
jgi:phosphoribosyl 1,2-cyclic phosphate phosphodiesterase